MFGGGDSIKLARIFGIRIGVTPSWFFVLFLIIWSLSGSYADQFPDSGSTPFVLAVASALLFFLSIVLHELGHAVVALRNGVGIHGIDLFMLGGVAKLDRDSNTPGEEFRIAAAGPAVTLAIAVVCFALASAVSGSNAATEAASFDVGPTSQVTAVLGYLVFINGSLLVLNLIPAYPLDGGRIARSIIWKATGDRTKATRVAALLGRGFGYALMAGGLALLVFVGAFTGLWFAFVGYFLAQTAQQERYRADFSERLEGLSVTDVMDEDPVAIPEDLPLDRAEDEFFLRYRYPWFPVVDAGGRFTGLVLQETIEGLPESLRAGRTVASVMARGGDEDGHLRVQTDDSLESLLERDGLSRLGALVAVDADGRLRGIVTADRVRRALAAA